MGLSSKLISYNGEGFTKKWLKQRFYLVKDCGVFIVDYLMEELVRNIPKSFRPKRGFQTPPKSTIGVWPSNGSIHGLKPDIVPLQGVVLDNQ